MTYDYKAFMQGYSASGEGLSLQFNPYSWEDFREDSWVQGWYWANAERIDYDNLNDGGASDDELAELVTSQKDALNRFWTK